MADEKFPAISPILEVVDLDKTIAFYEKFGFKTDMKMPGPGGKTVHAAMMYNGSCLMLETADETTVRPVCGGVVFYIDVPNVEDTFKQASKLGVKVVQPLADKFWGRRDFTIADLDGYKITFSQHVKDVTPEDMKKAMMAMAH